MPTKVCRHIRTNGDRCGSPALTSNVFCYYHAQIGERHRNLNQRRCRSQSVLHPMTLQDGTQREPQLTQPSDSQLHLDLPTLDDPHSVQLALSMLITALAQDRIEPRRAATLLYGLQIASSNAKIIASAVPPKKRPAKARDTVVDQLSGNLIAPDEDPNFDDGAEHERPSSLELIMKKLDLEALEREQEERERLFGVQRVYPYNILAEEKYKRSQGLSPDTQS